MCELVLNKTDNLSIWIPAAVSVTTLILNLAFYIFIQPRLTYKSTAKESLKMVAVEFLNYLAEIVSYEDFNGVPTQIRKYSLQIHLHFKKGTANGQLEILLEQAFKETQKRKKLTQISEIEKWDDDFRILARELRKSLAEYCGAL